MWSNTVVKWANNLSGKLPKTGIFTSFAAQNVPKIGPLRPIFHTPVNVITMSMWNYSDVKPVETVWKK